MGTLGLCISYTRSCPLTGRKYVSRIQRPYFPTENPRFLSLFEKHNSLDHEISRLEGSDGRGYSLDIVRLKKQKLHLKEDLLKILQKESVGES